MFWRSTDGGNSWKMQNPGLPKFRLPVSGENKRSAYIRTIQQIDSLNAVAICDSGYILHTFNGGKTWIVQDCHLDGILTHIHFSDPQTGILTAIDPYYGYCRIFITTNGGKKWDSTGFMIPAYPGNRFSNCYSFGYHEFRVFERLSGKIYTTTDNWQTVDSTKAFLDDSMLSKVHLNGCNLTGDNVLIIYGSDNKGNFLSRSTDDGNHWEIPVYFHAADLENIYTMTSLDRDTILAAGYSLNNNIIFSTDRGATWNLDSVAIEINFQVSSCLGISLTGNGNPIGIFSYDGFQGVEAILAQGKATKSQVTKYSLTPGSYLFPNPATNIVNIDPANHTGTIYIKDIFGRDVIRPFSSPSFTLPVDISKLSPGVYDVVIDSPNKFYFLDKLVVTEK
jgi:photosystem II stability/assembly factor-like uncharacterized protein